jgi:hypothetical protein
MLWVQPDDIDRVTAEISAAVPRTSSGFRNFPISKFLFLFLFLFIFGWWPWAVLFQPASRKRQMFWRG